MARIVQTVDDVLLGQTGVVHSATETLTIKSTSGAVYVLDVAEATFDQLFEQFLQYANVEGQEELPASSAPKQSLTLADFVETTDSEEEKSPVREFSAPQIVEDPEDEPSDDDTDDDDTEADSGDSNTPPRKRKTRPKLSKELVAKIREWAADQSLVLKPRGPISKDVVKMYFENNDGAPAWWIEQNGMGA